ncbi:hypothetical protein CYLTODRAFT_426247 [Cylindrobasidium torrendii FP15055 ss-10]|uniref:Uncharacterized protein n=1 Tax=Cylindrobasidium torrendii FP15055 ss-10 TaxID=1314674 RepID=A0A0D7AYJ3_9AGAR|nr:hypothetical protein CYLTODRAFT_426247 [Cylindrobasidium torrendii FP15055 ss-10]
MPLFLQSPSIEQKNLFTLLPIVSVLTSDGTACILVRRYPRMLQAQRVNQDRFPARGHREQGRMVLVIPRHHSISIVYEICASQSSTQATAARLCPTSKKGTTQGSGFRAKRE